MKKIHPKEDIIKAAEKIKEAIIETAHHGHIVHKIMHPIKPEVRPRDIIQMMVGAILLAIPVGFTEEVWRLGETLPNANIFFFAALSVLMISVFIYYNYYRNNMKQHWIEFIKRVLATYIFSFITVAMFLSLIQAAQWNIDFTLSLKRTILVAFPASMSAAVVDIIK